jgi:UDPglucose 6-dehydrogenase
MNLTVIGTGYVGTVTAAVFAKFGHQVTGVDVIPEKVKKLNLGDPLIHEPGLKELLTSGLKAQNLSFTTNYEDALKESEIVFVCVGTPQTEDGEVDLTYVESCLKSIARNAQKDLIIILKSTVPPGVHQKLDKLIKEIIKVKYTFASVPEFLREGTAVTDTLQPARVVIGSEDRVTKEKLLTLHEPFPGERITTDIISAQMIKYASNAILATKISFANAIARVCDAVGANVEDVMDGVGVDPRIGRQFLYPGLGFGGSCFPKDIKGLYQIAKEVGYDFRLMEEVDHINNTQVDYILEKILEKSPDLKDKKVALLGLAFKPDTDDMREAKSIPLAQKLTHLGAKVFAYDPVATRAAKQVLGNTITYCDDVYQATEGADVVILVTQWDEFNNLDLEKIHQAMRSKLFVDGRNFFDPEKIKKLGFEYIGVGIR